MNGSILLLDGNEK